MVLKKVAVFAMSVSGALLLFLVAAVLCIAMPFLGSQSVQSSDGATESAEPVQNTSAISVIALLKNGGELLAAKVDLRISDKVSDAVAIETQPIDPTAGVAEILKCAGIDAKRQNYIIFDEKIFSETADRYGGLVYNENGAGEVLLTGGQAVEKLDSISFCDFCEQITENACRDGVGSLFFYLADNTVNNLSFPKLYNALKTD